jgi:hypothetical protein
LTAGLITEQEFQAELSKGKACGALKLVASTVNFMYGEVLLMKRLLNVLNPAWQKDKVASECSPGEVVIIHRNGCMEECGRYRELPLSCGLSNIYANILRNKLPVHAQSILIGE